MEQQRNGPVIWPAQHKTGAPPPGTVLWRRQSPASPPPFRPKGAPQQTVPVASAEGIGTKLGRSPGGILNSSRARLAGESPSAPGSRGAEAQSGGHAFKELRNSPDFQREQALEAEPLGAEMNGRERSFGTPASVPGTQCCRFRCLNTEPGVAMPGKNSLC